MLEICWFDTLDSTQKYLVDALKRGTLSAPVAVATQNQPNGVGSRNNGWLNHRGNLFFSFALHRSQLPDDLPIQSVSLYCGFLLCELLRGAGSSVWMKWPNDLYLDRKKIGGVMTQVTQKHIICGIGLNLLAPNERYGCLDRSLEEKTLLADYLRIFRNCPDWKRIFSRFEIEFERSRAWSFGVRNVRVCMKKAHLNGDGSLTIESRRVYSQR